MRARAAVVACFVLAGCGASGVRELNRAALRRTNPRSIAGVMGPTPGFTVYTPSGGWLFGLLGAAVESSIDESKLGPVDLDDPALAIAAGLVDAMAKRFSLTVLEPNDLDEGVSPHLVLRVQTVEWGLRNAVNGGAAFSYEGTLEVTDTRTGEVIAAATCVSHPVDGASIEALAARDAAMLRDELRNVTEYCAEDFRRRILGLY